jgi:hypothetical protein
MARVQFPLAVVGLDQAVSVSAGSSRTALATVRPGGESWEICIEPAPAEVEPTRARRCW